MTQDFLQARQGRQIGGLENRLFPLPEVWVAARLRPRREQRVTETTGIYVAATTWLLLAAGAVMVGPVAALSRTRQFKARKADRWSTWPQSGHLAHASRNRNNRIIGWNHGYGKCPNCGKACYTRAREGDVPVDRIQSQEPDSDR